MAGEDHCARLLFNAAQEADLIIIEGVMGLFDGLYSAADFAVKFNIPVVAVINASAMAQTFDAVAWGLSSYTSDLNLLGVVANGVGSARHAELLGQSRVPVLAVIGRDKAAEISSRHLGIMQADEIENISEKLDTVCSLVEHTRLVDMPPLVDFFPPLLEEPETESILKGKRIAIARDNAFSFVYAENLNVLKNLGAILSSFSPIDNAPLPRCDAVYLPGGYPELHLNRLEKNLVTRRDLNRHAETGKPIYAECGGMMYLLDRIETKDGNCANMLGLVPGSAKMQNRLAKIGYQSANFGGGWLRGHTFHYSQSEISLSPISRSEHPQGHIEGENLYKTGSLTFSYVHAYFPSNPVATAQLFAT
jgi:cobyrinic acid a,c-diamide synthase